MKKFPLKKIIYQSLAFLIPFIIYLITLAPSVTYIDSGELANAASKLAIAHPTGYPLFTIFGAIFSKLSFGIPVYNLNLMSAIFSSCAVLILFNLLVFIATRLKINSEDKFFSEGLSETIIYNLALASSLLLGVSRTFWDSANSIEVYSLHSLFLCINIYLFLKAISYKKKHDEKIYNSNWLLFGFVLGLSFTNHMTTIFLSVGFLYLYFAVYGYNETSLKNIFRLTIPFVLGFSVYIYLIVRTGNNVISWGEPDTPGKLYYHIFGKQFSNLMFRSFEIAWAQLKYFIENYPKEFFIFPLLLIIPGLIETKKFNRKFLVFTLLLFFFNLLYAINYNVVDIENYFLLILIVSALWMFFGLIFIIKKFNKISMVLSYASILIFLLPLSQNYGINNKHDDYTVRDFINNLYKSAPENSIIISSQWTVIISPGLYYKFVENLRPDLVIINREQMSERWYLNFVKMHYPQIYNKSMEEFNLYETELAKFEKDQDKYSNPKSEFDNQEIAKFQTSFKNLMNSIVDKNSSERNVFITYEIEEDNVQRFAKDYSRIPQGMLFKLSKDKNFDNYIQPEFEFKVTDKADFHSMFITKSYLQAFMGRANYLMGYEKFDEAENLLNKALNIMPGSPEIRQLKNKLNQLKTGKSNK